MAREIRKENGDATTTREKDRDKNEGDGEREKSSELTRERKRVYPLHSNNCHLLSPFICTNCLAMALVPLGGQVFQRRRRLKGSMGDLDKSRRMHVLGSRGLVERTKESVIRFRLLIVATCSWHTTVLHVKYRWILYLQFNLVCFFYVYVLRLLLISNCWYIQFRFLTQLALNKEAKIIVRYSFLTL